MTPRPREPATGPDFDIEADGTLETVREVLAELRCRLESLGMAADQCGRIEIALAEALNNIVEHAYGGRVGGIIRLHGRLRADRLEIELRDRGQPLPGLQMPGQSLPDASGPTADLPEGGFGWFLIHDLTDRLSYDRIGSENCLCLGFVINPEES